jgi:catalase (peroxidase I)
MKKGGRKQHHLFAQRPRNRPTAVEPTRSDLIFGSNSQLRAIAEAYAGSDGHARFTNNFVIV